MKSNPFYALSASAMLLGCFLLGEALELEAGKLGSLLLLMAVLQVYELLLTGLGAFLVRSGRAPRDGRVVLVLASVFLMNATGLSAECVTTSAGVGALATFVSFALAVLKLWWVRRQAPELLPARVAVVLGAYAAFSLALPVVATGLAGARLMTPLALYGTWWAAAALPLLRRTLREATLGQAHAPKAHAAWTWMPSGLLLWQLWSVGYVHSIDFRPAFLAPFILAVAVAARPEQQGLKLFAPILAVLFSLQADPALAIHLQGADAGGLSPLRPVLALAGLAWIYLGWRDGEPWLAVLPIGGAALYLLGPAAGRLARALARMLADGVPRDRFGWGVLTVLAGFVLLAAGARRSLHGDPRWPDRLRRAHHRAEGSHADRIGR